MVAAGVTRSRLPAGNEVVCTLSDPQVAELAVQLGTTRTAAALELWRERLDGALVVVGNAPTALFRLLEIVEQGGARPAAVIGVPVGFIGAAESKLALAEHRRRWARRRPRPPWRQRDRGRRRQRARQRGRVSRWRSGPRAGCSAWGWGPGTRS